MPRWDLHTHYYPQAFFRLIEQIGGAFSFGQSPTGQTIIRYRGARFFGITPPMTDPAMRLADMDRVGIDIEVLSLSTPNVYFAPPERQAEVARLVNDAYAELIAKEPKRFKGFASIPMDDPDASLRELERALDELKLNGVVVLSNINGRALTDARYRPFFQECDRRSVCVFIHPMIPANAELRRVRARADHRLPIRHHARGRAPLLRRRVQGAAAYPLDPRSSGRRSAVSVRADGQRLARLRRVPRQDRRAARSSGACRASRRSRSRRPRKTASSAGTRSGS